LNIINIQLQHLSFPRFDLSSIEFPQPPIFILILLQRNRFRFSWAAYCVGVILECLDWSFHPNCITFFFRWCIDWKANSKWFPDIVDLYVFSFFHIFISFQNRFWITWYFHHLIICMYLLCFTTVLVNFKYSQICNSIGAIFPLYEVTFFVCYYVFILKPNLLMILDLWIFNADRLHCLPAGPARPLEFDPIEISPFTHFLNTTNSSNTLAEFGVALDLERQMIRLLIIVITEELIHQQHVFWRRAEWSFLIIVRISTTWNALVILVLWGSRRLETGLVIEGPWKGSGKLWGSPDIIGRDWGHVGLPASDVIVIVLWRLVFHYNL